MELLKSGWKSVLGSQEPASQPSVAETVERLVDRLQLSTLLEDRRDACRALKSLAKHYRLEVGAQGMDALIHVLEQDRDDNESVSYSLDALNFIISGSQEDPVDIPGVPPGTGRGQEGGEDIGVQFTEIFAKRKENISLVLDLLGEYDFKVRWPAIKLLMGLLKNKLRDVQDVILSHPMGVSKLMDLLSDSREVVRNDSLLLLVHLTRNNANIQKIVAFENAFDKLFEIIATEGYSDGGVVVEDCLIVIQNLLKNNASNMNFFKEGSYVQRLVPFLDALSEQGFEWSPQKASNVLFMLHCVRTLVSPNNPQQVTSSCQKVAFSSGLLERLCEILMSSGVPADILTETINTVSEAIRGSHSNQDYFSKVNAPTVPPKPAIVVLLMSMVNEKQPFELRCAVLYCFQCFLHRNELGQAQIVQTLLPSSTEMNHISTGQLLCGGLFSPDPVSNWLVAVAISYALVDNKIQKEQLLRVQLATGEDQAPTSLMRHASKLLQDSTKFQTRVGLLILMCQWLAGAPLAVSHFVSIPTNIPFLTAQCSLVEGDDQECIIQQLCAFLLGICIIYNDDSVQSFTKDDLYQLIAKRIGIETYTDKLVSISKLEAYSQSALKPQLKCRKPADLCFDYEFCRLYKSVESKIQRHLETQSNTDAQNGGVGTDQLMSTSLSNMSAFEDRILEQYKGLIRDQDSRIKQLTDQYAHLQGQYNQMCAEFYELQSSVQQLRDQNALLKAQKSASTHSLPGAISSSSTPFYSGQASQQQQQESNPSNTQGLPMNNEAYQYGYYSYPSSQQPAPSDQSQPQVNQNYTTNYASPMSAVSIPIPVDANEEVIRAKDAEINELRCQLDALRMSSSSSHGYQQPHQAPMFAGYGGDTTVELERLRFENKTLRETLEALEAEIKSLEENKNCANYNESSPTHTDSSDPSRTGGVNSEEQAITTSSVPVENHVQNTSELEQMINMLRQENEQLRSERETLIHTIHEQASKLNLYEQKLYQHGIRLQDDSGDNLEPISQPQQQTIQLQPQQEQLEPAAAAAGASASFTAPPPSTSSISLLNNPYPLVPGNLISGPKLINPDAP